MSLYHTPRMPAWSPPESLSGTPTSSACSLPRTPTDDAAPVPHPHHPLNGGGRPAPLAKPRDASSLAFAAQAKVLAARPVVVPKAPAALPAASSSSSATPNTALPTAPLGLAPPFSHAPAASTSSSLASAGPCDAPLAVLQPSTQQSTLAPSAAEPRRPASDASSATHNTPSVLARAAPGPGTPKANTASALASASTNGPGDAAAGVPPPAGVSRKRRKRSTPEQIEVLERHFAINDRPTSTARESIAKEVEMTPRQVTIWMQNRRQMRKKRLLEASGQMSYQPGSPSSLGAHPSSDSVGSIPSSEMDDLPFETVYGQRRAVNKENVRPIAAFRPAPVVPTSAVETPASKPSAVRTAASAFESTRRSPPLPRAARVASQRPSLPETPSGTSAPFHRAASPTVLGHTASHPAPTLLDKCVQSRELPFVHQKRSRSSDGTGRASGLPIMGWRDQPATEASSSGRDVWQHMMSDPPSGGLLELHEDESDGVDEPEDDDEDVKPAAKVRRTSSSSSAASSSRYLTVGGGGGGGRHQASSLPPHLEQRPSLRRSASLDCAASRPPAGLLKRARIVSKSAAPPDAREQPPSASVPPARRRASRDRSAESSSKASSSSSSGGSGGAVGSSNGAGAVKPDATDVECARLLMGLLGGA